MLSRAILGPLVLAVVTQAGAARAAIADANFVETLFAVPKRGITGIASPPDGTNRVFVLKKAGELLVVENGVVLPTPFATLTPVFTKSECGAIGLAFDPDFASNGYVYVFITVSDSEQQIVRYTANGNVGVDKTLIVGGLPTHGINHDGGALGFGPDGKLYWAIGDNGGRVGVDQDLLSLAAKIGRANRDGSVPLDNPFFDGAGPNNDYIWARGFRNPFTMTFQPATGRLWLNVAGADFEQIFTPQAGDHAGWDNYSADQPAGFLRPTVAYNNDSAPAFAIANVTRANGVVTVTTSLEHKLRPGAHITLAGVTDASFDGSSFVTSESKFTFTFAQAGANASSSGGSATPDAIGGCVTGGDFWDSSAVPAAFRGNFFFGDYNTGNLMRVQLAAQNQVKSVELWGSGIERIVDVALGPEGDLYYAWNTGYLFRANYTFTTQSLIVSRLNTRLAEGGKSAFTVRLAIAPGSTRQVTATRSSGDADVSLVEGGALSFTVDNWATPQRVLVAAAQDTDSLEDNAVLRLASSGVGSQLVNVKVTDDESSSLVVSPSELSVVEGAQAELQVSLTQPPAGTLTVTVARSGGDAGLSVVGGGSLTFNAQNWATPQQVTVGAAQDDDGVASAATLSLSAPGLAARQVEVSIVDDDEHAPELTTEPPLVAVVGAPYGYDADAIGLPPAVFSLEQAPDGMTIDPTTGVVAWTPQVEVDETVTIRATNGVLPDAVQTFEIDVRADAAPICSITSPHDGDVVSGEDAEFFGDVEDDVAAIGADFSIDGTLSYEDRGSEGHYHLGGGHGLFDTTVLSDGEHLLTLTGYDSSGQSCTVGVTVTVNNLSQPEPDNAGGAGGADDGAGGTTSASGGEPGAAEGGAATGPGGTSTEPEAAGAPGAGGDPPAGDSASDSGGCDCRAAGSSVPSSRAWLLVALAGLLRWRRRP